MIKLLMVFLGGGIGASLRYLLSLTAGNYFNAPYYGTFIVNILGCLFLGLVLSMVVNKFFSTNDYLILFLTVGIAGGFTTFSTFSSETFDMIKSGDHLKGFCYVSLSVILGLIFLYLGIIAGNIKLNG